MATDPRRRGGCRAGKRAPRGGEPAGAPTPRGGGSPVAIPSQPPSRRVRRLRHSLPACSRPGWRASGRGLTTTPRVEGQPCPVVCLRTDDRKRCIGTRWQRRCTTCLVSDAHHGPCAWRLATTRLEGKRTLCSSLQLASTCERKPTRGCSAAICLSRWRVRWGCTRSHAVGSPTIGTRAGSTRSRRAWPDATSHGFTGQDRHRSSLALRPQRSSHHRPRPETHAHAPTPDGTI